MEAYDIDFTRVREIVDKIKARLSGKKFDLKINGSARGSEKKEIHDCQTFGDQVYLVSTEAKSFSVHLRYETLTTAEVLIIAQFSQGQELPVITFEENRIGLCYQAGADWVIIEITLEEAE